MFLSFGTLSRRQRDLRMFFIYIHLCFSLQENFNELAWFILCEQIKSGKKKSIQYLSLKKTNLVKVIPLKKFIAQFSLNFP